MRTFRIILATVLAMALLCCAGCDKILNKLPGTPEESVSPSTSPTTTPTVSPTIAPTESPTESPTVAPTPVWRPTGSNHLKDLLNFADPDCLKLFSLGDGGYKPYGITYNQTFDNQWMLVEDYQCTDGCAVEIFIDSGTQDNKVHDLVEIDMTAFGLTLGEIGEIYVDYKMMDGDQLNDWWPRITINDNTSGEFDANTVRGWRADGAANYASKLGLHYAVITQENIASRYEGGGDLSPDDYFVKLGFQYYAAYGQYATFRIDSITVLTVDEVAIRDAGK